MNENDLDTSIIINQSSVSDLSKAIESLAMSPLFEAANQIQETLQKIFTEEFRDSLNQLSKTISSTLNSINSSINQVSKENFTDVETKLDHKSDYLMPDSFTYSNAESDDQTNELDEIKLMFIELCEKMEERETKASQNDSDNNQSDEKRYYIVKYRIFLLVGIFYEVCEFIEHSETTYQFMLWVKHFFDFLFS